MATRTSLYSIEYRQQVGENFQELIGASNTDLNSVELVARAYAEDHPGYNVRVVEDDEFIVGYKFNAQMQRLYKSEGQGWFLYD